MTGRRRSWALIGAYVVLLFAAQPRLGFAIDAFKARWGEAALDRTAYLLAAAAGAAVVVMAVRLWPYTGRADRLVLGAVGALYVVGVAALEIPQERLHYVEYGTLAGLLFVAVAPGTAPPWSRPGVRAIVLAAAAAGAIGLLDEILQGWLWERRYFDWADVWLNLRAGALGAMLAAPGRAAWRRARESAPQGVG